MCALLLVSFTSSANAEDYQLQTSEGETELYIPDDPTELREAYIDMASLYIEERFDHEKSLKNVENLLTIQDKYKEYYTTLNTTTNKLIKSLMKKEKVDLFRIYFNAIYRYDIITPAPAVGVGVTVQLFESFFVGAFYQFPSSVGISAGIRLY